ncbi:MAG: OmpA family protein [Gemmobacter sp.]
MGAAWRAVAALSAALWSGAAVAQDATLTGRDGGLALSGNLRSYDGEFYRIDTAYGLLTVDAAGVICTGPACPALIAPQAKLRIVGAADPGLALLPPLWRAFARARGLMLAEEGVPGAFRAQLTDPATGQSLADIDFAPFPPEAARLALVEGRAEMALGSEVPPGVIGRAVGADALVPVVAADNRLPQARTADLARALAGEIDNWQGLGGPDMPITVHGLQEGALRDAVRARLGRDPAVEVPHRDAELLAAAVARDPWALALTAQSRAGAARVLPLADSCGFPLPATPLAVKAEDYPLTVAWHILIPRRRLPLIAREFLEFLASDAAQAAVAEAGLIDRRVVQAPLADDGRRLLGAIRNAGPEVPLAELQRLAAAMEGGDRLSLTLRFDGGSSQLDPQSETNLSDLARLIAVRAFDGYVLIFAGFSDGSGAAATNLALSRSRAEAVRAALARIAPDLAPGEMPGVEAYGEALPMACDTTPAGRQVNRRVEVWLRPVPDWDGPRHPRP